MLPKWGKVKKSTAQSLYGANLFLSIEINGNNLDDLLHNKRLCNMSVHSRIKRSLNILRKGVCRHCNNRDSNCVGTIFQRAYLLCGFISVQTWHHNIHNSNFAHQKMLSGHILLIMSVKNMIFCSRQTNLFCRLRTKIIAAERRVFT